MRKRLFLYIFFLCAIVLCSCQNDDTDFSEYTTASDAVTTIYIQYHGNSVTVTGDTQGIVTTSGADVKVVSQRADSLLLVLSGTTTDGSLFVYRSRQYGIQLNGVTMNNTEGPAINNQCKKALYIHCTTGTTNTLTDGTTYAESAYDQKGTLFSEGQIYFLDGGTLNVTANSKNAIASDDFLVVCDDVVINTTTTSTGSNGLKANDGIFIHGGTLTIDVTSEAGRGIKCDSVVVVSGGTTTITTLGDCVYEEEEADYSSAACIKCDYPFTMTGGTLTMTSSGDGGKGINCDRDITVSGGTFRAVTTGSNINSKPKAVKSDTGIIVSGGSFFAMVIKSWACDNGTDSDDPAAHVTVSGTPSATATITVDGETYTSPYYSKNVMYITY